MNKFIFVLYIVLIFLRHNSFAYFKNAADSSSERKINVLPTFSGYLETYYCFDFSNPSNHERPFFLYNHKRHNEININLAYIKAALDEPKYRMNFALMTGNYSQYNLASEPLLLQTIYEANIGLKLAKNLWFDVGVFPSHIGFESAVSSDCLTLSRSLVAENSPYYETGAKLTWSPSSKILFSVLYLNGWQRINRISGQQSPCGGTQLIYKMSDNLSFNYSTFFGQVYPDSVSKPRFYNDAYATLKLTDRLAFLLCFDFGMEQKNKIDKSMSTWNTSSSILQYKISNKINTSVRYEHFYDPDQVIVFTGLKSEFQIQGTSMNVDFRPFQNILFRIEARYFYAKGNIFTFLNKPVNYNFFTTASLAIKF